MAKRIQSQQEIEQYGDIAVVIRDALKKRGWGVPQLNEALGKPRSSPGAYAWFNGTGGIGPDTLPKLAKVLSVPKESLQWRDKTKLGKQLVVVPPPTPRHLPTMVEPSDMMNCKVTDGKVQITFNVTMPSEQGTLLFRSIMDMYHMTKRR